MTEFVNRAEIERKLARVLSRDLRGELDKLMGYLGDPPDLSRVPAEYWNNGWRDIQRDVEPVLIDVFIQQAEAAAGNVGIGLDWALTNTDASNYARNNLEKTLRDLFGKTYDGVSVTVPKFFEQNWTIDDLRRELGRWHSPVRAEMIAVTETTRAAVEGERAAMAELEKATGKRMVEVWLTDKDDRVCLICRPRHKQVIKDGMYPPAHPRCRCMIGWERVEE